VNWAPLKQFKPFGSSHIDHSIASYAQSGASRKKKLRDQRYATSCKQAAPILRPFRTFLSSDFLNVKMGCVRALVQSAAPGLACFDSSRVLADTTPGRQGQPQMPLHRRGTRAVRPSPTMWSWRIRSER
jgi:hypothetical protein